MSWTFIAPAMLAVEVDGEAHARGDRPSRDAIRDAWLATQGVCVLRYSARDVLVDVEAVAARIVAIAVERRKKFAD